MTGRGLARRDEIFAIYGAGLIQGVALVTFPAASSVFTSAGQYGLSGTQYGGMFVPQAIAAIVSSLLGAGLSRRLAARHIYLLGLAANLLAMALLVASQAVMRDQTMAYGVLLVATGCLGAGFGLTVPTLNTFAAAFFPRRTDTALLVLNALLGSGTALAPVLVTLFIGLGAWWGLPVVVGALILGLLAFSARLALNLRPQASEGETRHKRPGLPPQFWVFAAFALLYGVCETMNGNWASIYMARQLHASTAQASLALAVFWGMVTAGRILFAVIEKWLPERTVCQFLPLLLAAGFIVTGCLGPTHQTLGILAFALGGLGCSALLPLVISFGQAQLKTIAASVAGLLIAFYQIGYGIAAFGVGPLQAQLGWGLGTIYGGTSVVAVALALIAALVARRQPSSFTEKRDESQR